MHGLLVGNDAEVAAWAFSTYSLYPTPVYRAFGIVDESMQTVGAILLQDYNGSNIELSYYGQNTLSAGICRSIARIVLYEFQASRLTVVTSKRNKRLMRSLQRFGFKLEGTMRCYFGSKDCARNTGVRFVAFRDLIEKVANFKSEEARKRLH